jgi:acetyl esterase/lipase
MGSSHRERRLLLNSRHPHRLRVRASSNSSRLLLIEILVQHRNFAVRPVRVQNVFAGNAPPLPEVEPRIARELPSFADALAATLTQEGKPTVGTIGGLRHKVIDGPGGPLLLRMYVPKKMAATLPVVVYFHGGGWVIASLDTYDASARSLADGSGAIVVSVAYRRAARASVPCRRRRRIRRIHVSSRTPLFSVATSKASRLRARAPAAILPR